MSRKAYKSRQDRVNKVIHRELCKKLKFDYSNEWYMPKSESILENEKHKIPWDFDIQTDHQISARRLDQVIVNKEQKTCQRVNFTVSADHRVRLKECIKRDKYLELARVPKKRVEQESDGVTNCIWFAWYSYERIGKGTV